MADQRRVRERKEECPKKERLPGHSRLLHAVRRQNGWPVGIRCIIGLLMGAEAGCGWKIGVLASPIDIPGEAIGPEVMVPFTGMPSE